MPSASKPLHSRKPLYKRVNETIQAGVRKQSRHESSKVMRADVRTFESPIRRSSCDRQPISPSSPNNPSPKPPSKAQKPSNPTNRHSQPSDADDAADGRQDAANKADEGEPSTAQAKRRMIRVANSGRTPLLPRILESHIPSLFRHLRSNWARAQLKWGDVVESLGAVFVRAEPDPWGVMRAGGVG